MPLSVRPRRFCVGAVSCGLVQDIESLTVKNDAFRRVLYTAQHCQLVVMSLNPKEEMEEKSQHHQLGGL